MSVFALLAALVAGATYNNELPPPQYQGNPRPSVLIVVENTNSEDTCGVAEKGWRLMACTGTGSYGVPHITMPNPCGYPEALDPFSYAHLLCHEIGHVNGWNSEHNN